MKTTMALRTLLERVRCSSLAFQTGSLRNRDLQDKVTCRDNFCHQWFAHGIMGAQIQISPCLSLVILDQLDHHQLFNQAN